jgi:phage/plasmid-like protein (TIGR03299 family)
MPAYFETGYSVREPMWHGLGKVLDDYPGSWNEARVLAGLDWDPVEVPCYEVGNLYADGRADVKLIEDFKQIKRSDNDKRLAIGPSTYEIITHDAFGEIFEAILETSDGLIKYETAGSLEEGKKVWVLAKLGGEIHLPGDPSASQPYLALCTSHDGTAALRALATNVRIVCRNTWTAADMDATKRGTAYSFKHTKNWRLRVEDAKKVLAGARENIDHTVELATAMLREKVNANQATWFIKEFALHRTIANTVGKQPFGKAALEERLAQPRVQQSLNGTIAQLMKIMDSDTTKGIRGTMYGLVQAAGEFADHHRDTKNAETYFSRTMLVDKEPLKQAAVRLAGQALNA